MQLHPGEVVVDEPLARALLAGRWADLPLRRVPGGTDHVLYRLGEDLSLRLPRIGWADGQGEREQRWLPVLAPHVDVALPVPLLLGDPGHGYPFRWYVAPWLPGSCPSSDVAADLAVFLRQLWAVPTDGAPVVPEGSRGGPLAAVDDDVRAAAEDLRGETDVDHLLDVWRAGVEAPPYDGPPRWLHGDLTEGNLLVSGGRLSAVLDWNGCAVGDPACDLISTWSLPHDLPRHLPDVDDATWARARAWAVCAAVLALPYYRDTEPVIVARSWRIVRALA